MAVRYTVLLPYSLLQVMRKLKLVPLSGEPIDVAISRFQYLGDEVSVHLIRQQAAYLLATLHTDSLLSDLQDFHVIYTLNPSPPRIQLSLVIVPGSQLLCRHPPGHHEYPALAVQGNLVRAFMHAPCPSTAWRCTISECC